MGLQENYAVGRTHRGRQMLRSRAVELENDQFSRDK